MHRLGRWLVGALPPEALAALALAAVFAVATALSSLRPGTAAAGGSPTPPASSAPSAPTATPLPSEVRSAPPSPSAATPAPDGRPYALARAPAAGGVIFQTDAGVWRYDGRDGTVLRVAARGRPTADGKQFIVRFDDGTWSLVDAAAGGTGAELAPPGALDVDWIGGGRPMAFVQTDTVTVYAGLRSWSVPVAGAQFVRLSPDGRRAVVGATTPGSRLVTDLVVSDLFGEPRTLLSERPGALGPTLSPAGWSPDGRYFAYFVMSTSGSINADGVGLRVVGIESGAVTDLGRTLGGVSRLSWAAPHTLAYAAGGGRETWQNKTLGIWSPEGGSRDITGKGEVGLAPSWSADGRTLYFIRGESARYDPLAFFAAKGSGDRRAAAFDVRSGLTGYFAFPDRVVTEGIRPASEGTLMLRVTRPIVVARSLGDMGPIPLELTLLDAATGRSERLVRMTANAGFGYYGRYAGPEMMAWSR